MNIGERIKVYRKKAGLTQQNLGDAVGVSFQAVSCWECNENAPSFEKLQKIAEALNVPYSVLVDEGLESITDWNMKASFFSDESMYKFIKKAANAKGLLQTSKVLPLAKELHQGQKRKGPGDVPYIIHPLMLACHGLALGLSDDETIATALLHDTVEDCNVEASELPVSDEVKKAINLLSFTVLDGETKNTAKDRYYKAIGENRIATIVKVLDRCNNISTMATAFTKPKMVEYILETEKYVMPLLERMKYDYPECYNAAFLIKYQMVSMLESLKRFV